MTSRRHDPSSDDDFAQVLREVDSESEHRPTAPQSTPPEWEQLMDQIRTAAVVRRLDPTHPLHLIGRFEALATRGVGGFGVVFEVRDPELDRHVALKLCQTRSPEAAEGLMAEAKVLAKLSHPNIVTVYEPGRHGEHVFFVMEYVEGLNGHRFGRRQPPPSWEEIVDVYRGAGRGLAAAHDAGVIHGDFKPSNILLDARDWPRVADFGLAQRMIEHTPEAEQEELRHRAGTLPYMAPEVLRGEPGDARSDQWSFCVSLWETLDQALPFDGETSGELLEAIERGDLWDLNPGVPDAVRDVVRVGLSIEPGERYPDMHALVHELDRLRQPPPESLPPPSELSPTESPRDRGGRGAARRGAFVGALLLVGAVVFGASSFEHVRAPPDLEPATKPAPKLGCASWKPTGSKRELDAKVRGVCHLIRDGKFDEASSIWAGIHDARYRRPLAAGIEGYTLVDLAMDNVVVAQTFVEEAERLNLKQKRMQAFTAAAESQFWAISARDALEEEPDSKNADDAPSREASSALAEIDEQIADVFDRAGQITGGG